MTRAFAALFAVLLAGCPDRSIAEVDPAQQRVEFKDIPVTVNRDVDILFLIDDSPSMGDKQRNLADNFPQFVDVLATIQGGLPNVHIGIATSDMGASAENGVGAEVPGCRGTGKGGRLQTYGAPITDGKPYLTDVLNADGVNRTANYTGRLKDVFPAMAKGAGTAGCGFEQHLEAIKQALDPKSDAALTNQGFLRESAYLAVILIADEDDSSLADLNTIQGGDSSPLGPLESFRCTRYGVTCDVGGTTPDEMNVVGAKSECHSNESGTYLTKVQKYIDFLRGLKADPNDVIVALIGGPSTPVFTEKRTDPQHATAIPALRHSCGYTDGSGKDEVADPSVRQTQLITAFPNRGTFTTICQDELSDGLTLIAQLLRSVIGSACIDGELATPYDCSVSDVIDPGKQDQQETVLPACVDTGVNDNANPGHQACWAILPDAAQCTTGSQLSLVVKRDHVVPAANTHVIANCVTHVTDGGSGSGQM